MRVAFFDPFSGASGDMVLGALIDAGVPVDGLRTALAGLDLRGYHLQAERIEQRGVTGTRVTVALDLAVRHPSRTWLNIRALIERSNLSESVQRRAIAAFMALADAEARVHGTSPDEVHFHEVGAVDSIIDIVAAAAGLELLGVDVVYSGPLSIGHGFVETQYGTLPVPAP